MYSHKQSKSFQKVTAGSQYICYCDSSIHYLHYAQVHYTVSFCIVCVVTKIKLSSGWPLSRPHEIPWLIPDFSSRGKQRLPSIECLPIWSTVIVSHYWKTGCGQIVNYLTVGVVTAGGRQWGVPLPSRLRSLGERCKLPEQGPGQSPGWKTSFGVFRAWKNTPDFTSPDFFHFPWLFPDQ